MDFTPEEKRLVREYMKRYKHSYVAMNMLMIARHSTKLFPDFFIEFTSFLNQSLKDKNQTEDDLLRYWHLHGNTGKTRFFSIPSEFIRASRGDLEAVITEQVHSKTYPRY
jgi:hypothetical protein